MSQTMGPGSSALSMLTVDKGIRWGSFSALPGDDQGLIFLNTKQVLDY